MKVRSFFVVFSLGVCGVCARGLSSTAVLLDEDLIVSIRHEDTTLEVTMGFLRSLGLVADALRDRFGSDVLDCASGTRVLVDQIEEVTDCVVGAVFSGRFSKGKAFEYLKILYVFHTTGYLLLFSLLVSVLEMAEFLRYAHTERLYIRLVLLLYRNVIGIDVFLELVPKSTTSADEVRSTKELFEDWSRIYISTREFRIKEKYRSLRETHRLVWNTTGRVMSKVFTRERLVDITICQHVIVMDANLVEAFRLLAMVRVLEYPDELNAYTGILEFYTNRQIAVHMPKNKVISRVSLYGSENYTVQCWERIQTSTWISLCIAVNYDASMLLYNNEDRIVRTLIFWCVKFKYPGRVNNGYRIIVLDYLVLCNVNGEIDFVDTSRVETVEIEDTYNTFFVFTDDDESCVFRSAKNVNVQTSSLDVLLKEDGTSWFPALETLTITDCTITEDVFSIIQEGTKVVCIYDCVILERDILTRLLETLQDRVFYIENKEEWVYQVDVGSGIASCWEDKRIRRVSQFDGHRVNVFLTLNDIEELLSDEPKDAEAVRETVRKSAVSVKHRSLETKMHVVKAVEDSIVFLDVYYVDEYTEIRSVCTLASLRFLSIRGFYSQRRQEGASTVEKEKQKLYGLFVHDESAENVDKYCIQNFDKNALELLYLATQHVYDTYRNLVTHFTNVRTFVLIYRRQYGDLSEIAEVFTLLMKAKSVEVAEILVNASEKADGYDTEFLKSMKNVLNECKRMRKIIMLFYRLGEIVDGLPHKIVTDDGTRSYVLKADVFSSMNDIEREGIRHIQAENSDFYRKFVFGKLFYGCHTMDSELEKTGVELVYELEQ